MVPIHDNVDPKRPKGISKAIESTLMPIVNYTSESLAVSMLQQRE